MALTRAEILAFHSRWSGVPVEFCERDIECNEALVRYAEDEMGKETAHPDERLTADTV